MPFWIFVLLLQCCRCGHVLSVKAVPGQTDSWGVIVNILLKQQSSQSMNCAATCNDIMMNQNESTKNTTFIYLALLLLSAIFVTLFSSPTSPLLAGRSNYIDSSIFMVIGKNWAQGNLPYVATWDHKGPMIFLANALGYLLTGDHIGIYLIQILSLFITSIFTFKSFRLFQPASTSFAFSSLILLSVIINYESGNLTEEYILPLFSVFYYALLKYFYTTDSQRSKYLLAVAFMAGLILAYSFLSRLTNAAGVCLGSLVLFIYLIIEKQYKTAWKAVGTFILGFMVLTVPTLAYFYAHDALDEMWYATITFNILNTFASGGRIIDSPFYLMYFFLKFIHCFFLLIPVILLFKKKDYKQAWTWLALIIGPLLWILPGRLYSHYGMTVTHLSAIAIILLLNMRKEAPASRVGKAAKYMVLGYALYVLASFAPELPGQIRAMRSEPKSYGEVDTWFDRYNVDKGSFLAYNYDWTIYIARDITPPIKYFFAQDPEMRVKELEKKVHDELVRAHVKWILVGSPITHKTIQEYVKDNYTLVATGNKCSLYHLNEDIAY